MLLGGFGLLVAGCSPSSDRSAVSDFLQNVNFDPPKGSTGSGPADLGGVQNGAVEASPPSAVISRPQIFYGEGNAGTGGPDVPVGNQVRRSADGVEINFDKAEIREVARVVLGDILQVPYSVDPRVQGEVTLSSGGPLPEADLLAVLETVLRSSNAALVRSGPTYAIVPLEELRGPGEVVPIGGREVRVAPGFGLTVVPLRYISAQNAAALIQPLVQRADDIRVDTGRNLILFSGNSAERQNVVDTLFDLDVSWLAGKAVGIFPLTYSTPEAVIPELEALFIPPELGGGQAPTTVRFLPMARLNAVLAIAPTGEQIREIQAWTERLDKGQTVGPQFYVYQLKHAPAEETARLLNEAFGNSTGGGGGGITNAASPFSTALSARPAMQTGGQGGLGDEGDGGISPVPTDTNPLNDGVDSGLDGGSGNDAVRIVANRTNNTLLIRSTPEIYESIESALRRLDTPPLQVLIEATIAEVTLNDELRYGLQYFFQFGSVKLGYQNTLASGARAISSLLPLSVSPGFNFAFTPGDSAITIDALSKITSVKVLSSPSVVVQDNNAAVLTVGDEVPVITRQQQSTDAADANVINNVEYRDTGVILEVKPRINNNQSVSIDVSQEVSRVVEGSGGDDGLTPTFTQRKITSRVNVTNNQTVILGGLIQDEETRSKDGIPGLRQIPVIGDLFGGTNNDTRRTELVVFITPKVIRNAADARDVSEELRARLRSIRPAGEPLEPPPFRDTRAQTPLPATRPETVTEPPIPLARPS
ncbi:MAG: type II secretion system secretin GspD [Geminicoccaceae bacterium]